MNLNLMCSSLRLTRLKKLEDLNKIEYGNLQFDEDQGCFKELRNNKIINIS